MNIGGSIWSLFRYEKKDLSDIPNSTNNYCCPHCGASYPEEDVYNVFFIVGVKQQLHLIYSTEVILPTVDEEKLKEERKQG